VGWPVLIFTSPSRMPSGPGPPSCPRGVLIGGHRLGEAPVRTRTNDDDPWALSHGRPLGHRAYRAGGMDRGELGMFLFTAERFDRDHAALAVLLGLNGLRVSESCAGATASSSIAEPPTVGCAQSASGQAWEPSIPTCSGQASSGPPSIGSPTGVASSRTRARATGPKTPRPARNRPSEERVKCPRRGV